jgi:hypothetical protein
VIAWTYQCNHEGARKLAAEHSHFLDQGDDGSLHREDPECMVALGRAAHDSVGILVLLLWVKSGRWWGRSQQDCMLERGQHRWRQTLRRDHCSPGIFAAVDKTEHLGVGRIGLMMDRSLWMKCL